MNNMTNVTETIHHLTKIAALRSVEMMDERGAVCLNPYLAFIAHKLIHLQGFETRL